MKVKRIQRTGPRPVRHFSIVIGAVAAFAAAPLSFAASAEARAPAVASGQSVEDFYRSQPGRLLWFRPGQAGTARQLVTILNTADFDGLDRDKYGPEVLAMALRRASSGKPGDVHRADIELSRAFVAYARDLRNAPDAGMTFVDRSLRPSLPSPGALLATAAASPSIEMYVANMGWMNPAYAPLRRALVAGNYRDGRQRDLLRINLERARVLPSAMPRYVIVNAAEQRLYMYQGGRVADSMRVVVGKEKPKDRTPMLASFLDHADLNPYWNSPPDLTAERIAPNVLKQGIGYLKRGGYQVLSDWTDNATVVDPGTIDWQAVADGSIQLRVRQLPGPGNSLGKVKFSFSNPYGVYLHDTPDKELLTEETRLFSGGCIRLEDAARFGTWLYGKPLKAMSKQPELEVPLERPVPIYVTYLTAVPSGSSITFLDDVYGWDAQRLAQLAGSGASVAVR